MIIKYIKEENKIILYQELLARKITNLICIELKEFLDNKWKNKFKKRDLIKKYYDYLFLNHLNEYLNSNENIKDKIIFQYSEDEDIKNYSINDFKKLFNITTEEIENNNLYDEYIKIKNYYDNFPYDAITSYDNIKCIRKSEYNKIIIWEYYISRRFKPPLKLAKDYLINRWKDKKLNFNDLKLKYKQFAYLNDMMNYIREENEFSEFKASKVNTDEEALEVLNGIQI